MGSMSETVPGEQVGESVTKSIVLPAECGDGMGKIRVAPMMDWTGSAEMSGSTRSYEGQKGR
jgi:hypothetical protein